MVFGRGMLDTESEGQMKNLTLISVLFLLAGCGGSTNNNVTVDACDNTCKDSELCTVNGICILKDACNGICNTSCGTCASNQFCSGGSQCEDLVYDFVIPTYEGVAATNVVFDLSTVKNLIGTDLGIDFTEIDTLPDSVGSYKKSFTLRQQVAVNLESWAPDQEGNGQMKCSPYCDQLTYLLGNRKQLQSIAFFTTAVRSVTAHPFYHHYTLSNGKLYIGDIAINDSMLYLTTLSDIIGSNGNRVEIPLTTGMRQATASYCTALNFVVLYEYAVTFDTDITRDFPDETIKISFVTRYEIKTK